MSRATRPAPWLDDTLAPNGRPVRANFLAWFRQSKVVDSSGTPLVVYHGTAGDFPAFEPAFVGTRHVDVEAGAAFFFTDDPKTADYYAKSAGKRNKGGAHIRPVYLTFQNPLISDFQEEGLEYLAEDIEKAKRLGHDGLIALNYNDGSISTHYIAFEASQIKSAIGNTGDFDPTNPCISDATPTPAPMFKRGPQP